MSERDIRQLMLMQESLRSFDTHRMSLDALASSLLNLCDAIGEIDPVWEHEFTQAVATLDSAGQATTEQRAMMGDGFAQLVAETTSQLNHLVTAAIASRQSAPADESQPTPAPEGGRLSAR